MFPFFNFFKLFWFFYLFYFYFIYFYFIFIFIFYFYFFCYSLHPGQARRGRNIMRVTQIRVLKYKYVADMLERRGPYREAHLRNIRGEMAAGRMNVAGAWADTSGAQFFFVAERASEEDVAAFARADPYVQNGLVTDWRVQDFSSLGFEDE